MHRLAFPACILALSSLLHAETEADLQRRIDEAIKAGGGVVNVPADTIKIEKGLMLKDAKQVTLTGADREKSILQLGPLAYAEASSATPAGESAIPVQHAQNMVAGMRLRIEADGEPDSFTKKPKPYLLAIVKAVEDSRLVLEAPLKFPVPAGTIIRHEDAPNLIEVRGASDNVNIKNLTLDGGSTATDPLVRTHAQRCGVFASSVYTYEKGPTGTLVHGLVVRDCTIRKFSGRGIALYAVDTGLIENCTITDTNDEAIDLDHFTVKIVAQHNRAERCHVGIELNDASDCTVHQNEFSHCSVGLNLWRWCKQPGLNERNRITENTFSDTEINGMAIATGTAENIVTGNKITNSGRNGIILSGSRQTVTGNRITGSKLKAIAVSEGPHTIADNE